MVWKYALEALLLREQPRQHRSVSTSSG